jgi:hypothetical protein
MLKAHPEYPDYQLEELVIILFSYTVIEVSTVVIKARCASIALSTML